MAKGTKKTPPRNKMPSKMAAARKTRKTVPDQLASKPRPQRGARRPQVGLDADAQVSTSPLLIAGIGASAGGLEAFSNVLEALSSDPGLAMILVQHLAPQHESALPDLLAARTRMPVVQAAEGMRLQPNRVYVIPPNVQMSVSHDLLHLLPRPVDRSQYTPIDTFLQSLAESAQNRAIAVILSGTASDGTAGVRAIKAFGGITIAQNPQTAKYDGMPRAAIASGFIDLVLSPEDIAGTLVSIARHPLQQLAAEAPATTPAPREQAAEPPDAALDQIFAILRSASGVDFRRYKRPTIERRLQRRMVLHKLTKLEDYIRLLREDPREPQALYQDILIHVTRFFRDPDSFAALAQHILPRLGGERRTGDQSIRIWIPGCSTGEEAYSIAMLMLEHFGEAERSTQVQVFATDISDPAIDHARAGVYPDSITADVSPERLRHFFTRVDAGYRVNKAVRDMCVFARQDLTRDPPFSKLDLIVCRNVLIYLGGELQKKLAHVFHYALKPGGILMLGNAETIGPVPDLFVPIDRKHRIYERRSGTSPADVYAQIAHGGRPLPRQSAGAPHQPDARNVDSEAARLIQDYYAPPSVIVDGNFNIVQFRGQTGAFLEPAPGEPSMNLLKMAREGLLHGLREALQQARKSKARARKRALRVRANGGLRLVNLEIVPLMSGESTHFLVLFEEISSGRSRFRARRAGSARGEATRGERTGRRAALLQEELASSREYLQSIIQDLEAANEELQSANEEVLSANEELQSTNEELDTAKEELQSINEELNTVNEELHGRNEELSRVNSDLMNLLSSVHIAIVIVASDLRIRRFTPMAERVLNLIPGDVGRPISHIKPNIDCPELEVLINQVIDTVVPCEREVRDAQGRTLSLRIRPYKNLENRIDGAVLALFDMDARTGELAAADLQRCTAAVLDVAPTPMLLLADGRILRANRAFGDMFGVMPADAENRRLEDLGEGWSNAALRNVIDAALSDRGVIHKAEIDHDFHARGRRRIVLCARRIDAPGLDQLLVLALEHRQDT